MAVCVVIMNRFLPAVGMTCNNNIGRAKQLAAKPPNALPPIRATRNVIPTVGRNLFLAFINMAYVIGTAGKNLFMVPVNDNAVNNLFILLSISPSLATSSYDLLEALKQTQ